MIAHFVWIKPIKFCFSVYSFVSSANSLLLVVTVLCHRQLAISSVPRQCQFIKLIRNMDYIRRSAWHRQREKWRRFYFLVTQILSFCKRLSVCVSVCGTQTQYPHLSCKHVSKMSIPTERRIHNNHAIRK